MPMINLAKENILARMRLPGSALQLALFRILLGAQVLYSSSSELLMLLQHVKGTTETRTVFPAFVDVFINANAVPYFQLPTQILSIFLIFGLFTRFILPLLTACFVLLFAFWYMHFNAPVPWLYLWFPLLILCFARPSDVLSLDRYFKMAGPDGEKVNTYRWPIEMICGWFAYIYFAAGLAKIFPLTKGAEWLAGGTSQRIIYDRYLDSALQFVFGAPFFDYSSYHWVFGILSIAALTIELFCVMLFFTRRYNNLIFFLVMGMHFFLYLTGVPGFMQTALLLSFCMFDPKIFHKFSKRQASDIL
jgi:hypothetical protein